MMSFITDEYWYICVTNEECVKKKMAISRSTSFFHETKKSEIIFRNVSKVLLQMQFKIYFCMKKKKCSCRKRGI
jgi:hypothetical protein